MVKNCKLVDNRGKRCIDCIECQYQEDKRRRPWIYEPTLNGTWFKEYAEEEEKPQKTLFDF